MPKNLTFNEIISYLLIIYEIVISVTAIVVTIVDKTKSRRGAWRISEGALMMIGALGGSLAMWLTMLIIRHKTKHPKFMLGLPAILLLHISAAYLVTVGTALPVIETVTGMFKLR